MIPSPPPPRPQPDRGPSSAAERAADPPLLAERGLLHAATDLIDAGQEFVFITVVRTQGSTPRNAGARMIWRPAASDAPNQAHGTVGGGQFEHLVLDAARECLRTRTHRLEKFVLGADADQCCGGVMEVFLEYHGPPPRVVIFGAGHVAHALAGLLVPARLEVIVVDDRPDWASADRFPHASRIHAWEPGVAAARERAAATLAVVMTCSHDTDFDLLRGLLAPVHEGRDRPVFVGLIGSRSKRACLFGRLVASGVEPSAVQNVRCPIGVGDTGKEPHAVAISIAAQVLMEAKALVTTG